MTSDLPSPITTLTPAQRAGHKFGSTRGAVRNHAALSESGKFRNHGKIARR